jgi:chorismate synthase
MGANTFGTAFSLTTFGESHSKATGGIIDGCPAGLLINMNFIESEMQRRKTQNEYGTARIEDDKVIFLSGLQDNVTLGTPIGFIINNNNIRMEDYQGVKDRPNHADSAYFEKFGIKALSGGGRASARETAARVVAGTVAKIFLQRFGITIQAKIETIGNINYLKNRKQAEQVLQQTKENGDTIGGKISCKIQNAPAGLGEPVFDKYSALLAHAAVSIPSVKSFEIGLGLESVKCKGSEDISEGLQGGTSNGKEITFSVGFKPISSFGIKGRHDVCQLFRACVIVEAMAALVTADLIKRNFFSKVACL